MLAKVYHNWHREKSQVLFYVAIVFQMQKSWQASLPRTCSRWYTEVSQVKKHLFYRQSERKKSPTKIG